MQRESIPERKPARFAFLAVCAFAPAACGSSDNVQPAPVDAAVESAASEDASAETEAPVDGGSGASDGDVNGDVPRPPSDATCHFIEEAHPNEGFSHVATCSPTVYGTNPPSSGNHYPIWAAYRTYTRPFLPGFWVHNLEHGAVVFTYNCPSGCPDDVAAAQAVLDALPADCGSPRRTILLPDPDLDVRFAASAWGFTLKADCFDAVAFSRFAADHYGHGLEAVCGDGTDPLTGGTNGTPLCP